MKINGIQRKIIVMSLVAATLIVIFIIFANIRVGENGKFTTNEMQNVPARYAALVLGTSQYLSNGRENRYFSARIKAAFEIYAAGRCEKIIVSGDNGTKEYNEPQDMKNELVKLGVPENVIICDYAGFRTLDSVVRMKEIFGQNSGIVVSQKFHNERAIYIAKSKGIDLFGYNADDVDSGKFKMGVREIISRAACVLDMNVFKTDPRYYGEAVSL